MRNEEFGVVTFKSTHHAIKGESIFKENGIPFKTIPTPREITLSCGLSLRFNLEDINKVIELIENDTLAINGVYKFEKNGISSIVKKII